jgi:WD repeat-containing protein 19
MAHLHQAMESLMGAPNADLEMACRSGIARCTLQLGDLRQGRSMVMQINSQQLYKECAQILETMQQMTVRASQKC